MTSDSHFQKPSEMQSQLPLQISACLSKDRHRLSRTLQSIVRRQAQKKPVDRDLVRLQDDIARSLERVQQRRDRLPRWHYPETLPVSARHVEITRAIQAHQVVIIAGETGSGKTTQIPKMCLQAGLGVTGYIGHTQPRRLAARTVAQRIAEELQTQVGASVGYKIRFQDQVSEHSHIKLMTDGMLLAEIAQDRFLSQYDAIIIDEAHERTLNIDFLLGFLKQLLPKRPDLKVIITSATIDHWRFSRYFNDAPVIEVSGRTYPVEILYRPQEEETDDTEDQVADDEGKIETAILRALEEIRQLERAHPNPSRPGDVLVFLAGERDIRQVAERLRRQGPKHLDVLPLYSRLSNAEQNRVFQSHTGRRVVLATNVAETSITVPNIGYVIDTGVARISRYSYRTKVQRLPIEAVSRASANQRAGRCGRVAEGICIRLYSEADFNSRPEYTEPEILRTNLASVILQMQGLKLGEVSRFPFVDPPDQRLVNDGYRLLEELGAVDKKRMITPLGSQLLQFPVDPRIARMLVAAQQHHCLQEMLIIASGLSVQEPWQRPHDRQGAADEALKRMQHEESDFLTFVNIWKQCEQQKTELTNSRYRRWLLENFLSYLRMREWQDVYRQLKQVAHQLKWQENTEPARYEELHRSILSGLLSHVAVKDDQKGYSAARNRSLSIFPGSTLNSKKPKWIMCAEIVETHKVFGRTVARIEPEWVEQVGEAQLKRSYFEPHWEKKQACTVAYEQTSLFGLILNPRKRVNYSTIDPVRCRELFIQHALVLHEYDTRAPYARHNQDLIAELEYLEQKSRRRDILIDDLTLYALFDAVVPPQVVNGKSFERWRKQAEREQPELLFLQKEQLVKSATDSISQWEFPDQVQVEGGSIQIDYQFEPGKKQDGLNIVVPVTLINQIEEEKLEWLVPGLEQEKCVALIKSLPKTLRKHFVPAPDFAAAFLNSQPQRDRSLKVQLATFLRERKRVDISDQSFDESALPLHLLANLKVLDGKGKVLAEGRDIRQIKMSLQGEFQQSLQHLTQGSLNEAVYDHWAFDTIPEVYETRQAGALVKAYPALTVKGSGVALQLYDTPFAAQLAMEQGLLRLCILALPQQVRYLKKQHSLAESVAIKFAPFGDRKTLVDGVVEMAFYRAFIADQPPLRTEEGFQQRLRSGSAELARAAMDVQRLLTDILQRHHEVVALLAQDRSPARKAARADIQSQLARLFPEQWLRSIPYQALLNYPRYLDAIQVRWQRLQGKIDRDQQLIEELDRLWDQYQNRLHKHRKEGVLDERLEQWRWALEEYRVSLFAQGVKTPYPVSHKRLQKMWQSVAS
ncbi:ATP-dependent RNA helicase HrpA [Ketobacter sp.]|uniref:ATP-dependent RNA helicase HrpA n=1 Tax=Ketobacter sp. TaxID=2083498 RepID=UPI0025BC3BDE|nr:ATP-dependent RNA helicase HrpA [Ketobacter sp.]